MKLAEPKPLAKTTSAQILILDDDPIILDSLREFLSIEGYRVFTARDFEQACGVLSSESIQLVITDLNMPNVDGLEFLRYVIDRYPHVTTIMITAYGSIESAVEAIKIGAYDYLTKPFSFTELLARIESLVRRNRQSAETETVLRVADLEMDLLARTVKRAGHNIDVQPREFRLLEYLMRNAGQVVTRTMLLEKVWDYHFDPQTNVIDVHISRLRAKIDKEFETPLLQTIRGAGYMLRETA